jgi:hypothetical protein
VSVQDQAHRTLAGHVDAAHRGVILAKVQNYFNRIRCLSLLFSGIALERTDGRSTLVGAALAAKRGTGTISSDLHRLPPLDTVHCNIYEGCRDNSARARDRLPKRRVTTRKSVYT